MTRLSNTTLSSLPPDAATPAYDRSKVTPGIVHLGIGAFHRAHMAVYVDDLLADDPSWGIVGASLRRPDTKDALAPQDGLYTVAVRDASGTKCRVIGSILEVLDANTERETLLALMASEEIRIVSLTVTEKGYCHDPATGELDQNHHDIVHDLAHPAEPRSAPGVIVEALARRHAAGIAPFTVMSCDNLPANGRTAERIVTRLANLRSPELGEWVAENVVFPSTMIDRIVPATTDDDRALVAEAIGMEDAWPIVTEPFTQWVIEDHFPAGRPAFEEAGAQIVDDVAKYELMKLRMLNGAHSTLAYTGYLAGYQYVSEVVANPDFRLLAQLLMEEAMATLDMPGADLEVYRDDLLARFANPALKHRTWQIAMDGTQKLPQRLLGTIRDTRGRKSVYAPLGVAAWMRYVTGTDENGEKIDVRDPMAERLHEIAEENGNDAHRLAGAYLQLKEVFGEVQPESAFSNAVTFALKRFFTDGSAATVRLYVRE